MKTSEEYIAIKNQISGFDMDILDHVLEQPGSQAYLMRKFKLKPQQAELIMKLRDRCKSKDTKSAPQEDSHNKNTDSSKS